MATRFDISDGEPAIVLQKGALKFQNDDDIEYSIDIEPRTFTKISLPEPVKAGKQVTIPANGSKKTGLFEIIVSETSDPKKYSDKNKKTKKVRVKPRMIIKVE